MDAPETTPQPGRSESSTPVNEIMSEGLTMIDNFLNKYRVIPAQHSVQILMFGELVTIINKFLQQPHELGRFCVDNQETDCVVRNLSEIHGFFRKCEESLWAIYDSTYHLDRVFDDAIFHCRKSDQVDTNSFINRKIAELIEGSTHGHELVASVRLLLTLFLSVHNESCNETEISTKLLHKDFLPFLTSIEDSLHAYKYGTHDAKRLREFSFVLGELKLKECKKE